MVNKYFKAARALIFWMGLYCLICKPVPTTTAFQKRCQIYYKGELEQNSSLAMHRGHYANTTREHISQSISSPLEKPPPKCLSWGEPSPPPPAPPAHRAKEWVSHVSCVPQNVSVSRPGAGRGKKGHAGDAVSPGILSERLEKSTLAPVSAPPLVWKRLRRRTPLWGR